MENASKALLFAAGILIAIILISVAVYIVSMSNNATTGVANQMTEMELKAFNQKFTTYEGTRTGSQIKTLVSTVNASNASEDIKIDMTGTGISGDSTNGFSFSGGSATKYPVGLEYSGGAVSKITIGDPK